MRGARWSARRPVAALVVWALAVTGCILAGRAAGTLQASGPDFWVGEAGRAERAASVAGVTTPVTEHALLTARAGHDRGDAERAAVDLARRWERLPAVSSVGAPRTSADGSTVLVTARLRSAAASAADDLPALRREVAKVRGTPDAVRVEQTGTASVAEGNGRQLGADLLRAERITLPVTLVVLVVVFGALLAAAVPLVLALASVGAALGLYALASHAVPDAGGAVANVVLLIGLAVGVDFSLFYLKRVREERARSGGALDVRQAVEVAAATSGRAVVVSALAVAAAMGGLYLADDVIFASIATGSILVVLVALASSTTALPALLVLLGSRIERRAVRRRGPVRSDERPVSWWTALLRPAVVRPRTTLALSAAALVALAAPLSTLTLRVEGNDTFPRSIPAIAAYHQMVASFPDEGVRHDVVVTAPPSRAEEVRLALLDLAERSGRDPLFSPAAPEVVASADRTVHRLGLPVPTGASDERSTRSLDRLRNDLLPATVERVPDATASVTGAPARSADYVEHQGGRAPLVVGAVIILTVALLTVAFRSLVLGLLGAVLNLLSAAAALGVVVLVFQHGWLSGLLGVDASGFVSSRIPLIVLVILFGISMDYQVFLLSRIRERAVAGVPTVQAVGEGIASSASVVTSAAVVMVTVFASFTFVGLVELQQIGIGLAVGVVIDAVVVRVLLLPAALSLLGGRAWWPVRMPCDSSRSGDFRPVQAVRTGLNSPDLEGP